jgi:hypothetical protein
MCQLHTETLFYGCCHSAFAQTTSELCNCGRDLFIMKVEWDRIQNCPHCEAKKGSKWTVLRHLTREEFAVRTDSVRRFLDFRKCQLVVAQGQGPDLFGKAAAKIIIREDFEAVDRLDWDKASGTPIPLNSRRKDHHIDRSYFITPELRIVPAGKIKPHQDSCEICLGSLTSFDPEESCSGHGARKLPCGHIYGRQCIVDALTKSLEKIKRCPHCRKEFSISKARHYSSRHYFMKSIDAVERNNGQTGVLAVCALFPLFLAVALSMNVAPKLNVDSEDRARGYSWWKRTLFAVVILATWPLVHVVFVVLAVVGYLIQVPHNHNPPSWLLLGFVLGIIATYALLTVYFPLPKA